MTNTATNTTGDLLSDDDVYIATGVDPNIRGADSKVMSVLDKAKIYYWIKHNGRAGTTWYHVHNAGKTQAASTTKTGIEESSNSDTFTPDFSQSA